MTLANWRRTPRATTSRIGIENRLHYHEIPQPDEARGAVRGLRRGARGYWHDVGHAEVQWRLGLVDKRRWLDVNGARCIGTHLHDVTGLGDHRAPGNGDVEWDYIRDGLPAHALRVFEINQPSRRRRRARDPVPAGARGDRVGKPQNVTDGHR